MSTKLSRDDALEIAPLSQPADRARPGRRHARVLRQVGTGARAVRPDRHAARRIRAWCRPRRPRAWRSMRPSNASAAACATRRAMWSPGTRLSRARRAQPRVDAGQRCARRRGVERLRAVAGDAGCHACHTQASPAPSAVPSSWRRPRSIAGLKRLVAARGAEGRAVTPAAAATTRWLAQRISAVRARGLRAGASGDDRLRVRAGLSAAAMLARTHASMAWPVFYGIFVLAVAVHAPSACA